eukprot:788811-Rhodomonas_salina.4
MAWYALLSAYAGTARCPDINICDSMKRCALHTAGMCLRPPYAMSGTDLAQGGFCLSPLRMYDMRGAVLT